MTSPHSPFSPLRSNVSAPYDPRAKLADSIYAETADKEHHALFTPSTPIAKSAPPTPQPPPASPVDIYPSGGIEFCPATMNTVGGGSSPRRQNSEEYVFVDVANFSNSVSTSLRRMGSGDMVTRTQLCSGYDALAEGVEGLRRVAQGWAGDRGEQSASLLDSEDGPCVAEDLYRQYGGGVGSSSAADTDSRRESGMADLGGNTSYDGGDAVQQHASRPVTFYVDGIPMFDPRAVLRAEDRQGSVLLGVSAAAAVDEEVQATAADAADAEDERRRAGGSSCGGSTPQEELERRCSIPLSQHLLAAALGSGSSGMLGPHSWTAPQSQSHDSYQQPASPHHSLRNSLDSCRNSRHSSSGGAVDDWIRHDERLSNNNITCPHPTYNNPHDSASARYCAEPTLIAHSAGGAPYNGGGSSSSSIPLASWQSTGGMLSPSPVGDEGASAPSVVLFDYHHTTTSFGSTSHGPRQWVTATPENGERNDSSKPADEPSRTRLQQGVSSQQGFTVSPAALDPVRPASDFQLSGLDELVQQQLA